MHIEEIENFLKKQPAQKPSYVKISFKKRESVFGIFVKDKDYADLKSKNFWRIVTKMHLEEFLKSKDLSLARIFNGSQLSRLSVYEEALQS
jgi:hypothetical protein